MYVITIDDLRVSRVGLFVKYIDEKFLYTATTGDRVTFLMSMEFVVGILLDNIWYLDANFHTNEHLQKFAQANEHIFTVNLYDILLAHNQLVQNK